MHFSKSILKYLAGFLVLCLIIDGVVANSHALSSIIENIVHPQNYEEKLASWRADPSKQVAKVAYPIVEQRLDSAIRPRFLHDNEIVQRTKDIWLVMGHVETRSNSGEWQKYVFSIEMQAKGGCRDYSLQDCWIVSKAPALTLKK